MSASPLPGPATAPRAQIPREGPRAGAGHTVRAEDPEPRMACLPRLRREGAHKVPGQFLSPGPVLCLPLTAVTAGSGRGRGNSTEKHKLEALNLLQTLFLCCNSSVPNINK